MYLSAIDFAIQWVLWGAAAVLKTEKFYDLAGIMLILPITLFSLSIVYFFVFKGHQHLPY